MSYFNWFSPPDAHIWKELDAQGFNGPEGWWSDSVIEGKRVIFAYGTGGSPDIHQKFFGIEDIFIDASLFGIRPLWNKTMFFHSGFFNYCERTCILLQEAFTTTKPIVFIGHSLGAAFIAITAIKFKILNPDHPCELQTYALPTCWASRKTCKEAMKMFPNWKNRVIGNDPTQIAWVLIPLSLVGPNNIWKIPSENKISFVFFHPIKYIKAIIKDAIDCHMPYQCMIYWSLNPESPYLIVPNTN